MFLHALAECGNVTYAAKVAGFSRQAAHKHRDHDPEFAAAWDDAMEQAADALEREGWRRAHDGVEEPLTCAKGLIYAADGTPVTVRKYSDTLLIFLLKGARPHKYRDRQQVEVSGQLDINTLASEADAKFSAFLAARTSQPVLGQPDASTES